MGEAISLFDLFKEHAELQITDAQGRTSTLVMRSLDVFENQRATKKMDTVRRTAAKRIDTQEMRDAILHELEQLKPNQIIDQIVNMERPLADDNADLAPPPPKDEKSGDEPGDVTGTLKPPVEVPKPPKLPAIEDKDSVEDKATKDAKDTVARWEVDRRAELQELSSEDLRKLFVDRQIRGIVGMEVITHFVDEQLARMVVDLENRPVFSLTYVCLQHPDKRGEPDTTCSSCGEELQPAPNHLARLHPSTKEELMKLRRTFLEGKSDKALRAVVTGPPSLPSGDSVVAPGGTPGATTEIPQLYLTG